MLFLMYCIIIYLKCILGVTHEQYVGCYKDGQRRVMPARPGDYGKVPRCISECGQLGYTYAGLEVSNVVSSMGRCHLHMSHLEINLLFAVSHYMFLYLIV